MTSHLAILLAPVSLALLFFTVVGFWTTAVFGWLFLLVSQASLKRAPVIELDGLSLPAAELLSKYNHAWASPGLTRITGLAIGLWQFLLVVAGIYFGVTKSWWSLAGCALLFSSLLSISGFVSPHAYIRRVAGKEAHDELVIAFLERHGNMKGSPDEWKEMVRGSQKDG